MNRRSCQKSKKCKVKRCQNKSIVGYKKFYVCLEQFFLSYLEKTALDKENY